MEKELTLIQWAIIALLAFSIWWAIIYMTFMQGNEDFGLLASITYALIIYLVLIVIQKRMPKSP